MTPQNGNLPNNAAATSIPDKNLGGLEVREIKEKSEVYGNQEESGPRENTCVEGQTV